MNKTSAAYAPAITSSATIPAPAGRASSCRTGGGFQMSNSRKSKNAPRYDFQFSETAPASANHCPTTSSTTTRPGSFFPQTRAVTPAAQMETGSMAAASTAKYQAFQPANAASKIAMASAAAEPA